MHFYYMSRYMSPVEPGKESKMNRKVQGMDKVADRKMEAVTQERIEQVEPGENRVAKRIDKMANNRRGVTQEMDWRQ